MPVNERSLIDGNNKVSRIHTYTHIAFIECSTKSVKIRLL